MSANDPGCVKTQKIEKCRELFFPDQAKANKLTNYRGYNCHSEKRSFYRCQALLRFYTAKTQSGHRSELTLNSPDVVKAPIAGFSKRALNAAEALPCGHYLSDEAPEETYAELRAFFAVG